MSLLKSIISKVDNFQRRHRLAGFPYAVVKKFGEDEAGNQAALLTYFGFLSLFPLLLVLTTVLSIVLKHYPEVRENIIDGATTYFPVVGNELQQNVHRLGKTGLALAIGIVVTLYGARGVGNAFRHAVNHVWQVPHKNRTDFPVNLLKNFTIIFVGGLGLIAASIIAGFSTASSGFVPRFVPVIASLLILFGLFIFLVKISLPIKARFRDLWLGAAFMAIGLAILQAVGGFVVTHELKNLDNLYGTFALVLGILFWIYLQAQIVLYALEIESVRALKLWPRSLTADHPTPEDKHAYELYKQRNRF